MTALILHGATASPQTVTQASTLTAQFGGIKPNVVEMFWSSQEGLDSKGAPKYTPFAVNVADSLWSKGQLYLQTWAPLDWKAVPRVAWLPADMLAGKYDPYFVAQAQAIAKWRHPVFIRLCHEMNGSWSPWNVWGPADFVKVWSYIVGLFRQNGATNVSWIWGPNQVDAAGSAASTAADKLEAWMPDPADFDWASWDAYNWGDARGGAGQSFSAICDLTYQTMDRLVPDKPLMLAEYGCNDTPGDKPAWIADALGIAPTRYPRLRAMLYYPVTPATGSWPLNAAAGAAYAAAIKAGPYPLTLPSMPPDLQPIRPLQSAQWGDSDADMAKQVAGLTADLKLANIGLTQAITTITDQQRLLEAAGTQHDADAASVADLNQKVLERGTVIKAWQKAQGDLINTDSG